MNFQSFEKVFATAENRGFVKQKKEERYKEDAPIQEALIARLFNKAEALILVLALIHGLVYLLMVPPWQHYDEPGHFEYAWLIANRGQLPKIGDYDQAMRREVTASMLEHNRLHDTSNLLMSDQSVWVAIPQLNDPPLYYMLAALPLRIIRHSDITFQLYAARSVSLVLYLLSIWTTCRLMKELTSPRHPLRWAVPMMMVLLPAYTDLMTAVNNDAGAVVVFSFFIWSAVRIILRGMSWLRLIRVLTTVALCVWTKNTAAVALLLAPLAIILALVRGRRSLWVWAGVTLAGIVLVLAMFSWGDAALWYRDSNQATLTRQSMQAAPLGQHVLALEITTEEPNRQLRQPLLRKDIEALQGQKVTLGAWMWATQPVQACSPMLYDGQRTTSEVVEVGTSPTFQAITAKVSEDAEQIEIVLQPLLNRSPTEMVTVYYDGVVLVESERPLDSPPTFENSEGRVGTWGQDSFINRVRNGSAEQAWPRLRPWVNKTLQKYTRFSLTMLMASLLDLERTGEVYPLEFRHLLYTFWARFGWSQVKMGEFWFWACTGWTALAFLGAVETTWDRLRNWLGEKQWRELNLLAFLLISLTLVWLIAILRIHPFEWYLSPARYTYPAISIFVLAFVEGFRNIITRVHPRLFVPTLILCLLILNGAALFTQVTFYYYGS
ncbi:MAG: hypothetical protein QHJ74_10240 [Anaerolineae bacterium]|nr:hypothetical protein [Anaerolineae bacterium]